MAGVFQIGGLVSGLDSAKIIDTLMQVERRPLDQLQTQQQRLKDRKDALAALNDKLVVLRSKITNLMLSTTTQARTASSGDPSVATATAAPNTAIQSFSLNVSQLATKTSVASAGAIGQPVDSTVPLASAGSGIAPTAGTFSLNGTSISVDPATDSLDDVVATINASGAGVFAAVVGNGLQLTSNAGPITVGSLADTSNFLAAVKLDASPSVYDGVTTWTNTSTGSIGTVQPTATLANARLNTGLLPPPSPAGTFTINGVAINWDSSTDSLNTIISRINSANAKVTASYDPASDTVTLKATNTGAASIALVDVSGNLLDALGLASAPQNLGKNAEYSIDGGPTQYSTSNLVSNAVPGVTLSLKAPGTTTIGVQQDVAAAVNGVKDFVTAYNEALDLVRKNTAVDPTTKKGSIFTGDSMVQGVEMRLRAVLNTAAPGLTTYTSLPAIGLSSGAIGSTPGSTNAMVLDEAKLTAALNADPAAVTSLLQSPTGPVANLKNYLFSVTSFTGPLNFGQQSADRQITDLDSRIGAFQRRLDMRQQALERKFNNLETAMAKLQAQSTQLAGQLGQLGSLSSLIGK